MKKDEQICIRRSELVKRIGSGDNEPLKVLISKIKRLQDIHTTSERLRILSDILYLSERTIWRDFIK